MVSTVLSCSSGGYSALPVDPGDGGLADGQLSGAVYIESISPSRGPSAGGLQLTLRGTGFAPQSTVRVAGQASPKVAFVSDKELLVTLPPAPGRIGLVLVEVITPTGKVTGRADLFSYYSTGLAFAPATSYLSGLKPVGIAASDLEPGVRECIAAQTACRAYVFHFGNEQRKREGGFWFDFLNIRRITNITGWRFEGFVVVNDSMVLFRNYAGEPRIERTERQTNPLGPFQPAGESSGRSLFN